MLQIFEATKQGCENKKDLQTETKDFGLLLFVATVLYNLWKSWRCHFPLRVLTDIKTLAPKKGAQKITKSGPQELRALREIRVVRNLSTVASPEHLQKKSSKKGHNTRR